MLTPVHRFRGQLARSAACSSIPNERAGGLGVLLARSRYLFIRLHRARFADTVLAELRGVIDEAGGSPFWDAIAGRFFGMNFQEADAFNGAHGTRFIADLMPKTPIYTAMLSESARAIMAVPHPIGPRGDADAGGRRASAATAMSTFSTAARPCRRRPTRSAPIREAQELALAGDRRRRRGTRMMLAAGAARATSPAGYGHVAHGRRGRGDARRRRPRALLGLEPGDTLPRGRRAEHGAGRDQFRRHRRAEPQLCRPQPRQPRRDRQARAASPSRARRRCRASRRCGTICALGLAQGIFLPHARPEPRLARRARHRRRGSADDTLRAAAFSASAMWAANAATVSPAPDTADGRCHLTVANLRTMAHRSHEWPETLAQLRLAFADDGAFRGPRAGPRDLRRRGRGQSYAALRRATARRASRSSSTA